MNGWENLETRRLILRPFRLSDAADVQTKAGDPLVAATTLNIPHPYPNGAAESWITSHQPAYERRDHITYAVTVKPSDEIIGAIGLVVNKRFNRAELGYWIERQHWGKGFATEAGQAMLRYGFEVCDFRKIYAEHLTRNPASGRVMHKLGMQKEGFLKEHVRKGDRYEDIVIFSILQSEWRIAQKFR